MKLKLLKPLWIFLLSPIVVFDNSSAVAQTSGCGSGSSWYLLRINSPIAANQFRVACDEHDDCYDTYGKSKQECDKAFHNRMLGICASDHNTIIGRPLRIACNGRADVYYTGVLEYAQDAYDKAQAQAKPAQVDYEERTRQLYRQILGREPDPNGFRDNVNAMRQHGFEWVRAGMAGSQESRNNINNLYRQYLCRDADPGGMDHHINLLASGQMALDQIRNGIANGTEAQQHKNGCR